MVKLAAFLTLLSLALGYAAALSGQEEILRPGEIQSYYEKVRSCDFKVTKKAPFDTCPGDRLECILEASTDEGEGYISIVRYGPYTTTGHLQETHCVGTGHVPELGSWMVGGVLGAVDAHTNEYLEYPPIHNHHIVPQTKAFNPLIPPALAKTMPWLYFENISLSTFPFPSGSADSQCLRDMGGVGCFFHKYPKGYGKRTYRPKQDSRYVFHLQDVRKPDSPPLSYYAEFAEHFITKMNPAKPLKPVVDVTMGVFGALPPFTYQLKYDTPMYNFVTYYFPLRSQLVGNRMHWHPMAGDETWIIRGTQEDLGIPKHLQRPAVERAFETPVGDAVAVEDRDMDGLKVLMERNIREANFNFVRSSSSIQRMTTQQPQQRQVLSKDNSASGTSSNLRRRTSIADDEIPYVRLNENSVAPRAPEILCKYLGQTETISAEQLQHKVGHEIARMMLESGSRRLDDATTANGGTSAVTTANYAAVMKHNQFQGTNKPRLGIVSREEQARNKYVGSQHGEYYRASTSSMQQGDEKYPHCNNFEVEAGEFVTIIHFIEPRKKPTDSEAFDSTKFTLEQHTELLTHIHIPQFPYI